MLLFLAFPPVDVGWAAYVAVVPLFVAIEGSTPGQAFLLGWLTGTIGCSALVTPSIATAAARYFQMAQWQNFGFALFAPQLYGAPYIGLFAFLTRHLARLHERGPATVLWVAAAWVAVEQVRSNVWHGAPWILLAHSQHDILPMIQIADLAGTGGVAFVVVAVSTALALALDQSLRRKSRVMAAGVSAALVIATCGYGVASMRRWQPRPQGERALRVALVQGDVPSDWRVNLAGNSRSLARLDELTRATSASHPDLVVWPENAVGFVVNANPKLFENVARSIDPGALLLIGAPRVVNEGEGRASFRNSAHLVAASGQVLASYDKIRLTPYAEYAPVPSWLRSDTGDLYKAGDKYTVFHVRDVPFATMICFEAIYPSLAREMVERGAQFLVNISNDDWFGGRAAIEQHFVASLFRSVETRRYLLRATNTGVSAAIDPRGAVIERLPANAPAQLVVGVDPISGETLYVRWGDWFGGLCVVAVGSGLLRLRQRK